MIRTCIRWMLSRLLIYLAAIFVAAGVVLFYAAAFAGPPPVGWQGGFGRASIVCDTAEQLQSIVDAFATSTEAAKQRFGELFALRNAVNEPTCAVTAIRRFTAGESIDLGIITMNGTAFHGWSVNIINRNGTGYYLYLEPTVAPMRFEDREGAV